MDFSLEWGDRVLTDIFGVYSSLKELQPVLTHLLSENEALFEGEMYVNPAEKKS
jgi:hypothetical protein